MISLIDGGGNQGDSNNENEENATEEWLLEYFEKFVKRAGQDPSKLAWIKVMMKLHFPINYWD